MYKGNPMIKAFCDNLCAEGETLCNSFHYDLSSARMKSTLSLNGFKLSVAEMSQCLCLIYFMFLTK